MADAAPGSLAAALVQLQAAASELEMLARTWRGYIDTHPAGDESRRHAGYVCGLDVCAGQVEDTLKRMRSGA